MGWGLTFVVADSNSGGSEWWLLGGLRRASLVCVQLIGLEMQKLILPVRVVVGRENVSVPNPHPTSFTLLLFLESKSDSCLPC